LVKVAKVGVLADSLIAGLAGYIFLLLMNREQKRREHRGGGA
jgi:Na+/H+ antiporter NhaA